LNLGPSRAPSAAIANWNAGAADAGPAPAPKPRSWINAIACVEMPPLAIATVEVCVNGLQASCRSPGSVAQAQELHLGPAPAIA